jgi:hypothetical protein
VAERGARSAACLQAVYRPEGKISREINVILLCETGMLGGGTSGTSEGTPAEGPWRVGGVYTRICPRPCPLQTGLEGPGNLAGCGGQPRGEGSWFTDDGLPVREAWLLGWVTERLYKTRFCQSWSIYI